MLENRSTSESGYAGPTYEDVPCKIREAFVKLRKDKTGRLFENRWEKMFLDFFQLAPWWGIRNVLTTISKVMEQTAIEVLFT